MKTIEKLREDIDMLDAEIMSKLNERFVLTDEIGSLKKASAIEVLDTNRELEVLKKIENNSLDKYEEDIAYIYGKIMEVSKKRQRDV